MIKNILLSLLAIIVGLIVLFFNLTAYTEKHYNFQPKRIDYDWGYITFEVYPERQDKVKSVYVYGNPYGITLHTYGDYSMKCEMKLEELSLKQQGDTQLYILDQNNFPESISIFEKDNFRYLYTEPVISIADYKTVYGSFRLNIICDGEVAETIEEKEIVLNTDYSEERETVWGVLGGI